MLLVGDRLKWMDVLYCIAPYIHGTPPSPAPTQILFLGCSSFNTNQSHREAGIPLCLHSDLPDAQASSQAVLVATAFLSDLCADTSVSFVHAFLHSCPLGSRAELL
jgi:hypothetical protein